jgi:hypothetical protein
LIFAAILLQAIYHKYKDNMKKVVFFIIGTQKGGTTALHSNLSRINGIQMSSPKEIHFFDDETIDWNHPDYSRLHACFDWNTQDVLRGEATPIYCYWPASIQRIQAYNPEAKIVMLLRHPAHRAYSQWRMEFQRGDEILQFADAISEKGRLRVKQALGDIHRIYSYVERGFYSNQIARLKDFFHEDQILFLRTDEYWSKPQQIMQKIARFLGVRYKEDLKSEFISPIIANLKSIPTNYSYYHEIDSLKNIYEKDIIQTQLLTGISLLDWLDPSYTEPMFAP